MGRSDMDMHIELWVPEVGERVTFLGYDDDVVGNFTPGMTVEVIHVYGEQSEWRGGLQVRSVTDPAMQTDMVWLAEVTPLGLDRRVLTDRKVHVRCVECGTVELTWRSKIGWRWDAHMHESCAMGYR